MMSAAARDPVAEKVVDAPKWRLPVSKRRIQQLPSADPASVAHGFSTFLGSRAPPREEHLVTGACHKRRVEDPAKKRSEEQVARLNRSHIRLVDAAFTAGDGLDWTSSRRHYGHALESSLAKMRTEGPPKPRRQRQEPANIRGWADLANGVEDVIKQSYGVHRGASGKRIVTPEGRHPLCPAVQSREISPRHLYGRKKAVSGRNQATESDASAAVPKAQLPENTRGFFAAENVGTFGRPARARNPDARRLSAAGEPLATASARPSYADKLASRERDEAIADVHALDTWEPGRRRWVEDDGADDAGDGSGFGEGGGGGGGGSGGAAEGGGGRGAADGKAGRDRGSRKDAGGKSPKSRGGRAAGKKK